MTNIIETKNITKRYGQLIAVDQVTLSIRKDEIYGFLGLNGAGKTTTIKLLLGMVHPHAGEAYILGKKIGYHNQDLWNKIGHLVEIPYSYPELTVQENLELFGRLRNIGNTNAIQDILEKLHLVPYASIKAGNLSQGNSQRLGLAKALFHHPEILILDEPSNGLDPAGIVEIREMLKDLAFNQGVTILVSSHNLSEISKLATRIGIIHHGKLIQEIDTHLLETFLKRSLILDTRNRQKTISLLLEKGIPATINEKGVIEITDEKAIAQPDDIASLLVQAGHPPVLLNVEQEDLESYFLRLIGEVNS